MLVELDGAGSVALLVCRIAEGLTVWPSMVVAERAEPAAAVLDAVVSAQLAQHVDTVQSSVYWH